MCLCVCRDWGMRVGEKQIVCVCVCVCVCRDLRKMCRKRWGAWCGYMGDV